MKLQIGDQEFDVQPTEDSVTVGDETFAIRTVRTGNIVTVYVNEKPHAIQFPQELPDEGPIKLLIDAKYYDVELKGRAGARAKPKAKAARKSSGGTGAITSQMTGRVIRVDVKVGDEVAEGDILLVVEAMKMENEISAPIAGTIKEVTVAAGARVAEGDPLLVIEPAGAAEE